ncbi:unknown [Firmicutes bacterium CAG:102]|nr:unknown [Firmicutes bacterium CAG:102]
MLKSFLFWGNGDWAQGNHLSCARKSSGTSTDWARSRQKFFLDNISHSPVWNSLGETEDSPLLFMLKSNKNLEPVSLWVPNLRTRGKGHKVSLSKPFPTDPKGYGEKRRRCACNLSSKVEVLLSNPIYDSDFFRLISEIRVKNILLFSMDFSQPIHLKKYPK